MRDPNLWNGRSEVEERIVEINGSVLLGPISRLSHQLLNALASPLGFAAYLIHFLMEAPDSVCICVEFSEPAIHRRFFVDPERHTTSRLDIGLHVIDDQCQLVFVVLKPPSRLLKTNSSHRSLTVL